MRYFRNVCLFLFTFLFVLPLRSQPYFLDKKINTGAVGLHSILLHPDGSRLILSDNKGRIYLWDPEKNFPEGITVHAVGSKMLSLNSTGKLVISCTSDGEIRIFDLDLQKVIQGMYSPNYQGINFALFSIADGFVYFNSANKLFKTRSDLSREAMEVFHSESEIKAAVITNDRNSLLIASGNKIFVLNTRSDIVRQELSTGNSTIEQLVLLGDSTVITWNSEGTIGYWHFKNGQMDPIPQFGFRAGQPVPMNFSADGQYMVSGKIGTWARVWIPTQRKVEQELFGHEAAVNASAFRNGKSELYTIGENGSILVWKDQVTEKQNPILENKIAINPEPAPVKVIDHSSEVKVNEENVPEFIYGRKVIRSEEIQINQSELTLFVFDNSYIDGDTMSLFFNGKWILDHYGVTKQKKALTIRFEENTNNYLVLFANNLGKSPPNTAAILFNDGKRDRMIRLSSDLSTCSALNFIYRKAP